MTQRRWQTLGRVGGEDLVNRILHLGHHHPSLLTEPSDLNVAHLF